MASWNFFGGQGVNHGVEPHAAPVPVPNYGPADPNASQADLIMALQHIKAMEDAQAANSQVPPPLPAPTPMQFFGNLINPEASAATLPNAGHTPVNQVAPPVQAPMTEPPPTQITIPHRPGFGHRVPAPTPVGDTSGIPQVNMADPGGSIEGGGINVGVPKLGNTGNLFYDIAGMFQPQEAPPPPQLQQVPQLTTTPTGPAQAPGQVGPPPPTAPADYVPTLPDKPDSITESPIWAELVKSLQGDISTEKAALDKYGTPPGHGFNLRNIGDLFSAMGSNSIENWGTATGQIQKSRDEMALQNILAKAELNTPLYNLLTRQATSGDARNAANVGIQNDFKNSIANVKNDAGKTNYAGKLNVYSEDRADTRAAKATTDQSQLGILSSISQMPGVLGASATAKLGEKAGIPYSATLASMAKSVPLSTDANGLKKFIKKYNIKIPSSVPKEQNIFYVLQAIEQDPDLAQRIIAVDYSGNTTKPQKFK